MKEHNFDGTDTITAFQFLIHFVPEVDKLKMSEGQVYLALPTYLIWEDNTQFLSMKKGLRDGRNPLLAESNLIIPTTYPTHSVIIYAVAALQNIRQK